MLAGSLMQQSSIPTGDRPRKVCVRLPPQSRDPFTVIAAVQALVVPDHVARPDAIPRLQPANELERGSKLTSTSHHVRFAQANVLDTERDVI